jgi:hypothetical protein
MGGPRLVRVVKRVALIIALLYAAVGAWSVYRSWVQVRTLELKVVSTVLRPGLPALVEVVTSGLTSVDVRLELVQGARSDMLATLRVAPSRNSFYNPAPRQGTMMPAFTPEFLAPFQAGTAVLRATATGRRLWGRTPQPVVREIQVMIAASGN